MITSYKSFEKALKDAGSLVSEAGFRGDVVILHNALICASDSVNDIAVVLMNHGGVRELSFNFEEYIKRAPDAVKQVMREDISLIRESMPELMHGANVVLSNSKFIKYQMKEYYGVDSRVIYPPIDLTNFQITSDDGDYYVSAQRMVDHKNVEAQIDAFADLDEELRIIGTGALKESIAKLAEPHDNIKYLGWVEHDELVRQYSGANAVIQTGTKEDFGYVPREGFATGTPAIVGYEGGFKEMMKPYLGTAFNPEDRAVGLREAVTSFDPEKYDEDELRKEAEDKYSLSAIKPQFERAVKEAYNDQYNN